MLIRVAEDDALWYLSEKLEDADDETPLPQTVLRQQLRLEDAAVSRLLALVDTARVGLSARLLALAAANDESHTPDVLRQLLAACDEVVLDLRDGMARSLSLDVLSAVDLGVKWAETHLSPVAVGVGFRFSPQLLTALSEFNASKVVAITEELRAKINSEVQVGWLAGDSVMKVAKRIGATGVKPIGPFKTVAQRADAIARTELNRAGNMATEERYQDAATIIPGLQKEWVATEDWRTRDTHRRADGQKVAMDGMFSVGGVQCRYPHDPLLPAREVVYCRCRTKAVVPTEFEEDSVETRGRVKKVVAAEPDGAAMAARIVETDTKAEADLLKLEQEITDLEGEMTDYNDSIWKRAEGPTTEEFDRQAVYFDRLNALYRKRNGAKEERREKLLALLMDRKGSKIKVEFRSPDGRPSTLSMNQKAMIKAATADLRKLLRGGIALPVFAASTYDGERVYKIKDEDRSYAYLGNIFMSRSAGRAVAVHELVHAWERGRPDLHKAALAFLEKRTAGEKVERLIDLYPGTNYKPAEITKRDKFRDGYTGRLYLSAKGERFRAEILDGSMPLTTPGIIAEGNSEVLTMGIQRLYEDPAAFAKEDPEYFAFVYDALKGKLNVGDD